MYVPKFITKFLDKDCIGKVEYLDFYGKVFKVRRYWEKDEFKEALREIFLHYPLDFRYFVLQTEYEDEINSYVDECCAEATYNLNKRISGITFYGADKNGAPLERPAHMDENKDKKQ